MSDDLSSRLAERFKQLRHDHALSLDQLARRCSVSRATLSRLENAEISPTAEILGRICSAYGLSLSRLIMTVEESFTSSIPRERQTVWEDPATGFRRRSVSPPAQALTAEIIEGELPPGVSIAYEAPLVPGQEHHLVMREGLLMLTFEQKQHLLQAGDCLRFRLFGPSEFRTSPEHKAVYLLVLV